MQYFTEQALTHREALEKIRAKYGDKAKILNHKSIRIGGFLGLFAKEGIEVSGYLSEKTVKRQDQNMEEEKQKILSSVKGDQTIQEVLKEVKALRERVEKDSEAPKTTTQHANITKIENLLGQNEFTYAYIKEIIEKIKREFSLEELDDYRNVEDTVLRWIGETITIYEEKVSEKQKVFILVGPTGVGKTTTIAKLAAIYGLGNEEVKPVSVRMITADNYRIGAKEQLETYGDIMEIPVSNVETFQEFKKKLALYQDVDLVLVDTTGKSPRDYKKLAEMREMLDAGRSYSETHLTLSTTTKIADIYEVLQQFEPFNYQSIVLTKLDETSNIGNVISTLYEKNKPISFITFGQGVPQDIAKATIPKLLMHLEGFTIDREKIERWFNNGNEDNQDLWS
jgi:flagellar biosynthesis protein FlhF